MDLTARRLPPATIPREILWSWRWLVAMTVRAYFMGLVRPPGGCRIAGAMPREEIRLTLREAAATCRR